MIDTDAEKTYKFAEFGGGRKQAACFKLVRDEC